MSNKGYTSMKVSTRDNPRPYISSLGLSQGLRRCTPLNLYWLLMEHLHATPLYTVSVEEENMEGRKERGERVIPATTIPPQGCRAAGGRENLG